MNILVVDDSKPMRMLVKRTLRMAGFGDHDVVEAGDGAEAFETVMKNRPDLVISDWNMPEMNGFEFLTKLREENIGVPFGFVTTEITPDMRKMASDAGAKFLIGKPFTAEQFEKELGSILG